MDNFDSVMDLCIRALNEIPDTVRAADVGSLPPIFGPDASDMVSLGTVYAARFFRCAETTLEYETNESGQLKSGGVHDPLSAVPAMQEALFGVKKKYKRPTETVIRKYAAMTAEKFSAALVDIITDKGHGALDADSILWRCLYAGVIYLQVREYLAEQKATFVSLPMTRGTSALTLINKGAFDFDKLTKRTTVTVGKDKDIIFEIDQRSPDGISTEAIRLCYFLAKECYRKHSQSISIPLRDYAELKERSTTKQALQKLRTEVLTQMQELKSIGYRCWEKEGGKRKEAGRIDINGGTAFVAHGTIFWNFNPDLYQQFMLYAPTDCPKEAWTADPRTNQFFFLIYIAQNRRLNEGKPKRERIDIKTLIERTPNLPTFEEVMKSNRHVTDRIIIPTFRDLDALESIHYDVYTRDDQLVDDPYNMDYETFINAYIKIDYSKFPAHDERIKKRQQRVTETRKAKGKRDAVKAAAAKDE